MKSFPISILTFCCLFIISINFSTLKANSHVGQNEVNPIQSNTIFQTLNATDILEVNLIIPLDSLLLNKKTNKYFPAALSYTDITGIKINRTIEVKTRGKSRRKICDFPPLKIKFNKNELAAAGIKETHKSLKLVTHCNDENGAMTNVLEEYLAYKIYNKLTDKSLKVQLISINYEDSASDASFTRYGILIEDIDELAERIDGKEVEGFGKTEAEFVNQDMQTFAMFQFMIGNEDWRVPFMRNIKFIEPTGKDKLIPIPYDFDASGLVLANYAKPDRDLRLKSVRQRAFMGIYNNKTERKASIDLFNTKKEEIYQLIQGFEQMNVEEKKNTLNYLDSFYEIINTPKYLKMALPLKGREAVPTNEQGFYGEIGR